ncbi:MAG TPA: hypothetical protein VI078_09920 [bacterium]
MDVAGIDTERFNPFGATGQELLANALDDAGLLREGTRIDGLPARAFLESFHRKRAEFREATKLGFLLVRDGTIDRERMADALAYQRRHPGMKFGEAILALGHCRLEDLERALAVQAKIRVDLDEFESCRAQVSAIRERIGASA